jgi:hypothetical protein
VLAKGLSERPGLPAPHVIQVPLRLAVVEPEAGRVAVIAGRRVAVANHRDVAACDQRRLRFVGICGGEIGRDHQQPGKKRQGQLTDPVWIAASS